VIGVTVVLTVLATFIIRRWVIMLECVSLSGLIMPPTILVDSMIVAVEGILANTSRGADQIQAQAASSGKRSARRLARK
jgi:multidrug efflux pump subunit AcrB